MKQPGGTASSPARLFSWVCTARAGGRISGPQNVARLKIITVRTESRTARSLLFSTPTTSPYSAVIPMEDTPDAARQLQPVGLLFDQMVSFMALLHYPAAILNIVRLLDQATVLIMLFHAENISRVRELDLVYAPLPSV